MKNNFKRTLIIGSIAVAIFAVAVLTGCTQKDEVATDDVPLVDDPVIEQPETIEPDPIVEPAGMAETLKKYDDAYAWIDIPDFSDVLNGDVGAPMSYPIAQYSGDNREYYLHKDLDGKDDKAGTLYTEKQVEGKVANSRDFSDPVTVIYGHNQGNRTMFGGLQSYMGKINLDDEHMIYMYQEGRRLTYQIVGGVQYDTSHILYYHDFTDDTVFNNFFEELWKETEGSTNVDKENMPVAGDHVLILSVCKNGDDAHRYLIVGKMIEDTDDPTTWKLAEPVTE